MDSPIQLHSAEAMDVSEGSEQAPPVRTSHADASSDSGLSSLSELDEDGHGDGDEEDDNQKDVADDDIEVPEEDEDEVEEEADDEELEDEDAEEDESSSNEQDRLDDPDVSDADKSEEEYDTEAETEKLESPFKPRTNGLLPRRRSVNVMAREASDDEIDTLALPMSGSHRRTASMMVTLNMVDPRLQTDPASRKRRRSGSASDDSLDDDEGEGLLRKRRSTSHSNVKRSADRRRSLYNDVLVVEPKDSEGLVDDSSEGESLSIAGDNDDDMEDDAALHDAPIDAEPDTNFAEDVEAEESDKESVEQVEEEEEEDEEEAEEEEVDLEEEEVISKVLDDDPDEEVKADGEDDELDPAVRNEDEMAKKKNAMDALMPIEKLFAIFRDKLFDERLSRVSEELELLNHPQPTHPEYLAMRQCLDARRDEKIELEKINLRYKTETLKVTTLAERAAMNSQFFQEIREARENHLEKLNERTSSLQKERKSLFARDPHFSYAFEPRRSRQILAQTAYNKEVSILSGIARHVGFPAAPEMNGVRPGDVEDDLKAMKEDTPGNTFRIPSQIRSRPTSRMTSITKAARAEDAAAEEQFLEKTPWANPYHPSHHHHALLLERQASAVGIMPVAKPNNAISTPAGQHWSHDMHRGAGSEGNNAVIGSASTIAASDPPSANGPSYTHPHSQNHRARGAAFVGFGSSPIDRRATQFQRNGNSNNNSNGTSNNSQPISYPGASVPGPAPSQGKNIPGPATEQSQPALSQSFPAPVSHDIYSSNTVPCNPRGGIFGAPASQGLNSGSAAPVADGAGPARREVNPFINNVATSDMAARRHGPIAIDAQDA